MCLPYVWCSSIVFYFFCLIVMSCKTFRISMRTNVFIFSLMILAFLSCLKISSLVIFLFFKKFPLSLWFVYFISLILLEFIFKYGMILFLIYYEKSQLNQDHLLNKLFVYHWLVCHLCFILDSTSRFYQTTQLFACAIIVSYNNFAV